MRAEGFCKLHGKETDSSGSTMDEDSFAGAEMAVGCEPLPCGERSDGDGSGLFVGQRFRFIRNRGGGGDAELGECAFLIPVVHAINGLPYCDVFDSVAAGADIAGKFVSRDGVFSGGSVRVMRRGLPLQFCCDDSGSADANEQLALPGFGNWALRWLEGKALGGFNYLHDFHRASS